MWKQHYCLNRGKNFSDECGSGLSAATLSRCRDTRTRYKRKKPGDKLEGETYRAQEASEIFLGLTSVALTRLIADSQQIKRTEWLRNVRELARTLKA